MRSLRGRLLALWFLLLASAGATGFLLLEFYRQSAAVQVAQAEELVSRSCREIVDRYAFFSTGWSGPGQAEIDEDTRRALTSVVQTALSRASGVEGGIWQARLGSLAYAFPTYEGTGPKTDIPSAELAAIRQVNAEALRYDRPITVRNPGRSQLLVLQACPLAGPMPDATAWAMARTYTGRGAAYNQLLAGLGVLALSVLGSALFLGRLLFAWSRRIGQIEAALARHNERQEDLPTLSLTGERELDRLVSALNQTTARLAETRRHASAAERLAAVGRLAAGMAHEIRNPIAAMRLKAENALAAEGDDRPRAALASILDQIARLDGLLRDLLAMTQRNEPRREAVDVGKLLARCADANRELAAAKGISIEVDAASMRDLDRPVLDPEQIGRALDNLVLNAIQNTPAGTNGRVRLGATRDGSHLKISVIDTGPGVPEHLRERCFDPFVTDRADGTGLGLAIVREIARAHGGEARLIPSEQGAVFEIELPWQPS
jgi:signal transduction histidine kinase